jgi:hypothetical protein
MVRAASPSPSVSRALNHTDDVDVSQRLPVTDAFFILSTRVKYLDEQVSDAGQQQMGDSVAQHSVGGVK